MSKNATDHEPISYDVTEGYRHLSGATTTLYLDPEERRVYTYHDVGGNSRPMRAHHRRHLGLASVPLQTVAASLEAWLREHEGALSAICACYEGTYWDGSNHVGSWSQDLPCLAAAFEDTLGDALTYEIGQYLDADSWISSDTRRVLAEVIKAESIKAYAEELVAEADVEHHVLDQDDAEKVVRNLLERERDDLEYDEDDLDDAGKTKLAKIRQLLGE